MSVKHNGSLSEFPANEWEGDYLIAPMPPMPTADRLLDLDAVDLPDLTREGECAEMTTLAQRRGEPERAQNIVFEAVAPRVPMFRVLEIASLDPYRPTPDQELIAWMEIVLGHIDGVVWRLKRQFNRPRPYHVCMGLTVLPGVPRPAHASYPSGHATMAHTVAGLLSAARPSDAQLFRAAAAEVALNREIAGVHFPSDSLAGERLAAMLVEGMLNSSAKGAARFLKLMNRLR